jgi:hypothetical protein
MQRHLVCVCCLALCLTGHAGAGLRVLFKAGPLPVAEVYGAGLFDLLPICSVMMLPAPLLGEWCSAVAAVWSAIVRSTATFLYPSADLWIGCCDSRVPCDQRFGGCCMGCSSASPYRAQAASACFSPASYGCVHVCVCVPLCPLCAGLKPGELFVHRNIANQVNAIDVNVQSAIQYAGLYRTAVSAPPHVCRLEGGARSMCLDFQVRHLTHQSPFPIFPMHTHSS